MEYQPRRDRGAFKASKVGNPSQAPPSATPWPMRNKASSQPASAPIC